MSLFLAALSGPSDAPHIPEIRDIVPPVEPPIPLWVIIVGVLAGLALLTLVVWLAVRLARRKPAVPPPTPRAIALRALEQLAAQVRTLEPYAFSIAVSDVLRHFIGQRYGLRAEQQTSPEFLASIREARDFSERDRQLLADFLERCDLVKFARVPANETTSEALLKSAFAFVEGGPL